MQAAKCGAVFALLVAGGFSVSAGQDDPRLWLPLQVGNKWIYDHEWKAGSPQAPEAMVWTTVEVITWITPSSEGLVAGKEVKVIRGSPSSAWVTRRGSAGYLVHGNFIYFLTSVLEDED